jgi:KUP system potassium uptake protein
LGYLPRMTVRHTSQTEQGQIYMPLVNWLMMLGVLALVLGFGSSSAIAGAYGIAVMGTMSITTVLAMVVAARTWRWPNALVTAVFGPLLAVDLAFLAATLEKIPNGGWFPLLTAISGSAIMWTWWRGRAILTEKVYGGALPLGEFLERLNPATQRVQGTAVFMTGTPGVAPPALLHSLKHGKTLHERVVLLTVVTEDVPGVAPDQRAEVKDLGKGFFGVLLRFGFMEDPDVATAIEACAAHGLSFDVMSTSFYLGRETLVPMTRSKLPKWQQRLFIALSANAMSATAYFRIPPGRVVELGTQIEI